MSQPLPDSSGNPPADASGDDDAVVTAELIEPNTDNGNSLDQDSPATANPQNFGGPSSDDDEHHLHIATLWLPAVEAIAGVIVPAVIAIFFVGPFGVLYFATFIIFIPAAIYHAVRYFTLSYRIHDDEVVIRYGILSRIERRIPLDRVQEVEIRQGLLHQLLNLAKVDISTAGQDSQGASLNVLTHATANRLKTAITTRQHQILTPAHDAVSNKDLADYSFHVDLKSLVIGGLTSKVVATFGAIVGAVVYFQLFLRVGGKWAEEIEDETRKRVQPPNPREFIKNFEEQLPDFGPWSFASDFFLDETLGKSIVLAVGGLFVAVAAYVIRYFNFRLRRDGDMLHTSHGLLTVRQGTLARNRIQALKVEEGLLRRWLGMAAVRVDSAGDRQQVDENKNRDVLVPVAMLDDAHEVARQAIPGLDNVTPSWSRVSRIAILRGSRKGWMLVVLAMLQTYALAGWLCLAWIPAFVCVYVLNYKWYHNSGYWLSEDYFLWRSGWINRSTVCLPIRNIQNVLVVQNPFDRRLKLATISLDIAGQSNTGGGPKIRNLPVGEALTMQRTLADRAAESEFSW